MSGEVKSSRMDEGPDKDVENPEEKDALVPTPESTPIEKVFCAFGMLTALGCILSIVFGGLLGQGGVIVIIAGGVGLLISTYTIYQQRSLTEVRAMMQVYASLTKQVEVKKAENDRLSNTINDLNGTIGGLKEHEQAYGILTTMTAENLDDFSAQIDTNKNIVKQLEIAIRKKCKQIIYEVLQRSDLDRDGTIEGAEVGQLFEIFECFDAINFDEYHFQNAVTKAEGNIKKITEYLCERLDERGTRITNPTI